MSAAARVARRQRAADRDSPARCARARCCARRRTTGAPTRGAVAPAGHTTPVAACVAAPSPRSVPRTYDRVRDRSSASERPSPQPAAAATQPRLRLAASPAPPGPTPDRLRRRARADRAPSAIRRGRSAPNRWNRLRPERRASLRGPCACQERRRGRTESHQKCSEAVGAVARGRAAVDNGPLWRRSDGGITTGWNPHPNPQSPPPTTTPLQRRCGRSCARSDPRPWMSGSTTARAS